MANVVEILIRARDDASRALKGVEGNLNGVEGALGRLPGVSGNLAALAPIALAAAGAATKMALAYANAVEQMDRLALNTGFTNRELQITKQVIEDAGGEFGGFATAIAFFNRQIAEGNPLIKQLGLDTTSTSRAFFQFADIVSKSEDVQKRAWVMQQLLSRGSKEMAADLVAVAKNYDATGASMQAAGAIMDEDVMESARALDAQMEELGRNWKGIWNAMQEATVGPVGFILAQMNELIKKKRQVEREGFFKGGDIVMDGVSVSAKRPGSGPDSLAGVTPNVDTARAKKLDELRAVLRGTGLEAAKVLATLEQIERGDKLQAILAKLDAARPLAQRLDEVSGMPSQGLEPRGLGAADVAITVDDLAKVPEAQLDALTQVRAQWDEYAASVLDSAAILDESLSGLWNGLQAGFGAVFRGLTSDTQTFASAMKTIFEALVQEILAMLARIAAARAFAFLTGLIFGGPAGAAAGAGAAGATGALSAAAPGGGGVAMGGDTYNVSISSIDARTSLAQLVSPFGALRTGELRAYEAGA